MTGLALVIVNLLTVLYRARETGQLAGFEPEAAELVAALEPKLPPTAPDGRAWTPEVVQEYATVARDLADRLIERNTPRG